MSVFLWTLQWAGVAIAVVGMLRERRLALRRR